MMNVCNKCGVYRADKRIDPVGPYAICPECGNQESFLYLPLLIVSGASGTGKSTICNYLTGRYRDVVLLDSDILWRSEFNRPEGNHREFFETWLRMCKNISQSGRPVVLHGAGMGVPDNLEDCIESRYFSAIHYLALICSDDILSERLLRRPKWRGTGEPENIEKQKRFNQWFMNYNMDHFQPPITLLDTSDVSFEETASQVEAWIRKKIDL